MKKYYISLSLLMVVILLVFCSNKEALSQASTKKANIKYTIVIDAGHQKHQNLGKEPIGPGANQKKAKVSSGTQGRFTKVPEYEVNLKVAQKLEAILKKQGYRVIMIREKNDVNISNSERAKIANRNNATTFIRIHCNGSNNSSVNGILTICPSKSNQYCKKIYKNSRKLSDRVLKNICHTTGAKNNGIMETDSMSGINWSKVPVTIVEMGYMSNKKEDYKLTNSKYQALLAKGIAQGVAAYLN